MCRPLSLVLIALFFGCTTTPAPTLEAIRHSQSHIVDEDPVARAKAFFGKWVELSDAFDPVAVGYIADDARIINERHYPGGRVRKMEMTGAEMKSLALRTWEMSKSRNDISRYDDCVFEQLDDVVVVKCQRTSALKGYAAPAEFHVSTAGSGLQQFVFLHIVSRPF